MDEKNKIKIKCHRCNYYWHYKGNKRYAKCPNCLTSVKVREFNPEIDIIKKGD